MPTYQYQCTTCSHAFELVQKFTDPAVASCPECASPVRKIYSAVGIVFKGSGFYATDNRATGSASTAAPAATTDKPADKPAAPLADKPAPAKAASPAA